MSLLDQIKMMSTVTDEVIVSFSMGKDSIVVLDLAMKYFKKVHAFYMYMVPDLEFQERALKKYEQIYNIKIERVPHFETSEFYRYGSFREADYFVPKVTINDVYEHVRDLFGCHWIAGGERKADSIFRNGMINKSTSLDVKRGRMYPLAYWKKADVLRYIKLNKCYMPRFYKELGFSLHSLAGKELYQLKQFYPDDYKRVLKFFPEAQAGVLQYEAYKKGSE